MDPEYYEGFSDKKNLWKAQMILQLSSKWRAFDMFSKPEIPFAHSQNPII